MHKQKTLERKVRVTIGKQFTASSCVLGWREVKMLSFHGLVLNLGRCQGSGFRGHLLGLLIRYVFCSLKHEWLIFIATTYPPVFALLKARIE